MYFATFCIYRNVDTNTVIWDCLLLYSFYAHILLAMTGLNAIYLFLDSYVSMTCDRIGLTISPS